MISLMGFIVLMGTVVNNGIVFVDYANQLRLGGMERRAALVATGRTRMRPILMTTLTTVLAMLQLVFSGDMASQLMSGMATFRTMQPSSLRRRSLRAPHSRKPDDSMTI